MNISDSNIYQKKIYLNNDSLPNSMRFIPLGVIDILKLKDCRGDCLLNIQSVYDIVNELV